MEGVIEVNYTETMTKIKIEESSLNEETKYQLIPREKSSIETNYNPPVNFMDQTRYCKGITYFINK